MTLPTATLPFGPPRTRYTGILDGNHGDVNHIRDLKTIVESGIGAWIAKATEGLTYDDPEFDAFVPRARAAGLLVGAYQFLRSAHSGAVQADEFLKETRPHRAIAPMILALDWESHDATPEHARDFVKRVHEVTEKWPIVYAGEPFLRSKIGRAADPVLSWCEWWYPAYGVDPNKPHIHATWPKGYALMQYTNGGDGPRDQVNYPRKTPGIGGCDRSCYNGTEAEFRAWWDKFAIGLGPSEHL